MYDCVSDETSRLRKERHKEGRKEERKEGLTGGRTEDGKKDGRKEGRKDRRKEGRKEGRKEARKEARQTLGGLEIHVASRSFHAGRIARQLQSPRCGPNHLRNSSERAGALSCSLRSTRFLVR